MDKHVSERNGFGQFFFGGQTAEWQFEKGATQDMHEQIQDLLHAEEQNAQARLNNAYEQNRQIQDSFRTAASQSLMGAAAKGALVRRGTNVDEGLDTTEMRSDIEEDILSVEDAVGDAEAYADASEDAGISDLLEADLDGENADSDLRGSRETNDGKVTQADVDAVLNATVSYDAGFAGIGANIAYMGERSQEAQAKVIQDITEYYDTLASTDQFTQEWIKEQLARIDELGDVEQKKVNTNRAEKLLQLLAAIVIGNI